MTFPLVALALSTQLVAVSADRVPTLDMNPTCRSPMRTEVGGKGDVQVCLNTEAKAREEIVRRWSEFNLAERTQCSDLASMGGPPSYVAFLTCLEMTQQAHGLEMQGSTSLKRPAAPR